MNLDKVVIFLESRKDKILWNTTESVKEMAKEFGRNESTIWGWIKPLTDHSYIIRDGIVYFKKGKRDTIIFAEKYMEEVEQKYNIDLVRIRTMDEIRKYQESLKKKKSELNELFDDWLRIEIKQRMKDLSIGTHRLLAYNPESAIDMAIDELKDDERNKNKRIPWQLDKTIDSIKIFYAVLTHPDEKIRDVGQRWHLLMLDENKSMGPYFDNLSGIL